MRRKNQRSSAEVNETIIGLWRVYDNIIDDHTGDSEPVDYLVELNDDQQYLCAGYLNTSYFSLNPVYMTGDRELHLSKWTVAGTIVNKSSIFDKNIEDYNKGVTLDRMKIRKVYFPNGEFREYAV